MISETPSNFLIAAKAPITIVSPQISASITFSASDFTMDLPMVAIVLELRAAPSDATESHPIQHSLGINVHARSPAKHSGTRYSGQIKKNMGQADLHHVAIGTVGPPPLFRPSPHAIGHPGTRCGINHNQPWQSVFGEEGHCRHTYPRADVGRA